MPDLYAALGVARDVDTAAIRKAYRKAAKRAHPDGGGSPEKFLAVNRAMEVLTDAKRRKAYDETGTIDDKPADNEESELMGFVSALLDAVLQNLDQQGVPFETADLIQRMKQAASQRETALHQNRQAIKDGISRQRKLLKRFKLKSKKDVPNRMETLISGRIAYLEGQTAHTQRQIDTIKRAVLFLDEYKFESEKMTQGSVAQYITLSFGTGILMNKRATRWMRPFEDFLKHMRIDSKEIAAEDERGSPLNLWGSQRMFLSEVATGLEDGQNTFVCLKARQEGISTVSLAIDIFWCLVHPGMMGALVTDTEANRNIFRATIERYIKNLPAKLVGENFKIPRVNRDFILFPNGSSRLDFWWPARAARRRGARAAATRSRI